ncbi:serine hydrolase domain-containing protein [Symbioplanes lichenis]|uniref:serine hydrolase domain-containing protein n=1 Tax=Symbioplanes lichenis TaxID=1629072 RepID=UPI002739AE10|nr:serine hydrolase domain-containing protein [Actinoplanes lichenis]
MRASRSLAAALLVAVVAGSAAPAAAATTTRDRTLQAAVDDLHGRGVTGVQGLARTGGTVVTARAGVRDLRTGQPVPVDGYFRMGSNTKTFVAVVALQLVGEGKLSLDDTVERWLPGVVTGNGNDGRTITVRNLLQHTSGIADYTGDLVGLSSYENYLAHRLDHHDAADLVALAMRHEPGFAAGTHWSYSNTNYILAGMIIEKVTGRPWATEVSARILRPLGLRETSMPGDVPFLPGPHARGYQQWEPGGELTDVTVFNPTVAGASGGMVTTPSDLARFWQALQRGRLLQPQQMAQMHDTVLAETVQDEVPGARYGLGIMFLPNRCGGAWAHLGDVPGTSTANAVSADGSRVAIVALSTQLADEQPARAVQQRTTRLLDDIICGAR